jgi:hypothetical protein
MYRRVAVAGMAASFLAACVPEAAAQPVRVSVATDGTAANGHSSAPAISDGGRFVAFVSEASNLVAGDTNGIADVFLRDRDTDADGILDESGAVATVRVSERAGVQANGPSQEPVITPDGRYVFFASRASTLFSFGQPPLAFFEVFRWDRTTGAVTLVSQTEAGEPLNGSSRSPAATSDGNVVHFVSDATNGPGGDPGISGVILRRDIASATLTAVSERLEPHPRRHVEAPSVSADGAVVLYAVVQQWVGLSGIDYFVVRRGTSPAEIILGTTARLSRDGTRAVAIFASPTTIDGPLVRLHLPSGAREATGLYRFDTRMSLSSSGRFLHRVSDSPTPNDDVNDAVYGALAGLGTRDPAAIDGLEQTIACTLRDPSPSRQITDVVVLPLSAIADRDQDGLNDGWERTFGLRPDSATGVDGPGGDPDADGVTNSQELAGGSNPVGTHRRLLAEGTSSSDFFSTRIAFVNPGTVDARVAVRFDAGVGLGRSRALTVPHGRRVTLDSHLENLDGSSFSTAVESDQPLVVDRLVSWGTAAGGVYGSHAETSVAAPAPNWFLAEGSTVLGFQLFYLLQNPQETPTSATIRYLLPSGTPVIRTYELPARSRTTVDVNTVPGLASTDVSAEITATQPIVVERAMYRSNGAEVFSLGHAAAGVTAPSATWFFGEGATGAFFDTYLLLANPSGQPASVQVEYFRNTGGAVSRTYAVPANSRFSVFVDGEPGMDGTSFGTRITSSVPIVAERAMYWAGGFFDYYEGHVSAGATQSGSHWVLAEGEQAGPREAQTYVLVTNTGAAPVTVRISVLSEIGGSLDDIVVIPGNSRRTFSPLNPDRRAGIDVSEIDQGSGLTGALVVEGSLYWNAGGRLFGAGANWPATRLP